MSRLPPTAVVMVAFLSSPFGAQATLFHCENGALVRRVELAEPPSPGFVCEVIYWKDAERPGAPAILWQARSDRGYCAARAAGLVDKLTALGWHCAGPKFRSSAGIVPPAPPLVSIPTMTPNSEPRLGLAERAVFDLGVGHTLVSLRTLWPGRFDAIDERFGDLDGDGRTDAVVLIVHRAEDGDRVYYLVAYLHQGDAFRPAAVRNVGGHRGGVRTIGLVAFAGRQVTVTEAVTAGGACCSHRQTAFALVNRRLVPVDADPHPTSGQRPQLAELLEQAEKHVR